MSKLQCSSGPKTLDEWLLEAQVQSLSENDYYYVEEELPAEVLEHEYRCYMEFGYPEDYNEYDYADDDDYYDDDSYADDYYDDDCLEEGHSEEGFDDDIDDSSTSDEG